VRAERAAKQRQIAAIMSVSLTAKKNRIQTDERKVVDLDIAYLNKSDKDIERVKGVLILTNIYGDAVSVVDFSYDGGISATRIVVEHRVSVFVDQAVDSQLKLWDTDFDKLKTVFEMNSVAFKDGSSISAP
jgi:hypothetical protein